METEGTPEWGRSLMAAWANHHIVTLQQGYSIGSLRSTTDWPVPILELLLTL